MSEKVVSAETDYYEKLRGSKSSFEQNTLIWLLAVILSMGVAVMGILDWLADYSFSRQPSNNVAPTESNTVTGGWFFDSDLDKPYYVEIYTSQNGDVSTRTLQSVFDQVVYRNPQGGFLPDFVDISIHHWIVLAIVILVGIPSVLIYQREGRRLSKIDENLPFLLREIADSQRIGMQLPRAIAESAKRNYGPLTPELKKLAAKVSWGIPFRDAMMAFREAVSTPLSRQATILILEAERSGGELEKIFDS
ncbi:MAG: type II secretion system F family protein, partial [Candidatus Kariarchaeaceae archaeon]